MNFYSFKSFLPLFWKPWYVWPMVGHLNGLWSRGGSNFKTSFDGQSRGQSYSFASINILRPNILHFHQRLKKRDFSRTSHEMQVAFIPGKSSSVITWRPFPYHRKWQLKTDHDQHMMHYWSGGTIYIFTVCCKPAMTFLFGFVCYFTLRPFKKIDATTHERIS